MPRRSNSGMAGFCCLEGRGRETWHVTAEVEALDPASGDSVAMAPMTVPRVGTTTVAGPHGGWFVVGGAMEGGWDTATNIVDRFERPGRWGPG